MAWTSIADTSTTTITNNTYPIATSGKAHSTTNDVNYGSSSSASDGVINAVVDLNCHCLF